MGLVKYYVLKSAIGLISPRMSRIIRIKNTLRLDIVAVSEAYTEALRRKNDIAILSGSAPMAFDQNNNLLPF